MNAAVFVVHDRVHVLADVGTRIGSCGWVKSVVFLLTHLSTCQAGITKNLLHQISMLSFGLPLQIPFDIFLPSTFTKRLRLPFPKSVGSDCPSWETMLLNSIRHIFGGDHSFSDHTEFLLDRISHRQTWCFILIVANGFKTSTGI